MVSIFFPGDAPRKCIEAIKNKDDGNPFVLIPNSIREKYQPINGVSFLQIRNEGNGVTGMAVEQGGNCEGSELNQTVVVDGVRIIGFTNLPAKLPTDASSLYSRNMLDFLKLIINDENKLHIPDDDDIVSATLVVKEGKIWN